MDDVIASFERRSEYFVEESSWASSSSLNHLIAELVLRFTSVHTHAPEVLDYGAGSGQVTAELARLGAIVDAADVSDSMLKQCRMARHLLNPERESIKQKYDAVVLRQVLQYIDEAKWIEFVSTVLRYLKPHGVLVFSQIVPYCRLDYEFWKSLVSARRTARRSFPTENEFLLLLERVSAVPVHFIRSATRQSLNSWIEHEDLALQGVVRKIVETRSAAVSALWDFKELENGDLSWRNCWVHVVVKSLR